MTQLLFHNGTKVLMIGVPKDGYGFELDKDKDNYWKSSDELPQYKLYFYMGSVSFRQHKWLGVKIKDADILGTFSPPSELTFEVNGMTKDGLTKYLLSQIKDCKEEKFVIVEIK